MVSYKNRHVMVQIRKLAGSLSQWQLPQFGKAKQHTAENYKKIWREGVFMSSESEIKRFVLNELLLGGGPSKLASDDSLISSGLLDSMDMLRLIAYIEEQFGIVVEAEEVTPENFETLHFIKSFVKRKRRGCQ